jgi:hypothetical protein
LNVLRIVTITGIVAHMFYQNKPNSIRITWPFTSQT